MSNFNPKIKNIATAAPEYIVSKQFTWQSDLWNLGIISSQLFSDALEVFKDIKTSIKENHDKLIEDIREFYLNSTNSLPDICWEIENIFIKSIVMGILRKNYEERPSIFEVVEVYNELVNYLNYDKSFKISYHASEQKSKFFHVLN